MEKEINDLDFACDKLAKDYDKREISYNIQLDDLLKFRDMYHENEREITYMQKEYLSYDMRMKALDALNRELQDTVQDLRDVNYE